MQVSLPATKYGQAEQRVNFFNRLLEQLRTVPGVVDAAASEIAPGSAADWTTEITIEDDVTGINNARTSATAHIATSTYFKTLGVPVVQGREFTDDYRADRPLELIVSESFARRYWPNGDALGKRFRAGNNNPVGTVVGIVGDIHNINPQQEPLPALYFPYGYIGMPGLVVLVRTSAEPETLATTLRAQVQQIDREQPVYNVRTMKDIIANATSQQRFQSILLNLFGLLALLLVASGIYGVVSHVVRERTREIGVRIALGAGTWDILKMVVGQGMRHVLLGLIFGLAGSFALTRWLSGSVAGLNPNDPLTFFLVALLLIAVGFVACFIPARQAIKVDPSTVLRNI
jgi:putative ABC transport system permease protein